MMSERFFESEQAKQIILHISVLNTCTINFRNNFTFMNIFLIAKITFTQRTFNHWTIPHKSAAF
jgi:hypothetical protein